MNTKANSGYTLVDFSATSPAPEWYAVNDGVMGGESRGGPAIVDGQLIFSGQISLENNGGFSSVKSSGHQFDVSAFHSLRLRVKGDGRNYQLRLYTDARYGQSPIAYTAGKVCPDGHRSAATKRRQGQTGHSRRGGRVRGSRFCRSVGERAPANKTKLITACSKTRIVVSRFRFRQKTIDCVAASGPVCPQILCGRSGRRAQGRR